MENIHRAKFIPWLEARGYFGESYLSKTELTEFLGSPIPDFPPSGGHPDEAGHILIFGNPAAGRKKNIALDLIFQVDYRTSSVSLRSIRIIEPIGKTRLWKADNLKDIPDIHILESHILQQKKIRKTYRKNGSTAIVRKKRK